MVYSTGDHVKFHDHGYIHNGYITDSDIVVRDGLAKIRYMVSTYNGIEYVIFPTCIIKSVKLGSQIDNLVEL